MDLVDDLAGRRRASVVRDNHFKTREILDKATPDREIKVLGAISRGDDDRKDWAAHGGGRIPPGQMT